MAPYLSSTGAYGGPTSVAEDACRGLAEHGVEATLLVGWDGECPAPTGPSATVRARARFLVPGRFPTAVAPRMWGWLLRHARQCDVVHVHATREINMLMSIVIALVLRRPVVLQTHGMVQPHAGRFGRLLDAVLTRRLLRAAHTVLALTEREAEGLRRLAPGVRVRRLGNPAPRTDLRASWAPMTPRVVFLSRLHPRKRPTAVVEAAAIVARTRPDVQFDIWGADEGELASVEQTIGRAGIAGSCRYRGTCARTESLGVLAGAQVFVLPSVDEPFPMAALEAFSVGLPVVLTPQTGVSAAAQEAGAAVLTDGSPQELAAAVLELLGDRTTWESAAVGARSLAEGPYAAAEVVEELMTTYREATGS